jgi:hypothetical protein
MQHRSVHVGQYCTAHAAVQKDVHAWTQLQPARQAPMELLDWEQRFSGTRIWPMHTTKLLVHYAMQRSALATFLKTQLRTFIRWL